MQTNSNTMKTIKEVDIRSYHTDLNNIDLNEIAKQFDSLTQEQLNNELKYIENTCCTYNSASVSKFGLIIP